MLVIQISYCNPSVLELRKLSKENDIYSLVTEEDTKMPELEENFIM